MLVLVHSLAMTCSWLLWFSKVCEQNFELKKLYQKIRTCLYPIQLPFHQILVLNNSSKATFYVQTHTTYSCRHACRTRQIQIYSCRSTMVLYSSILNLVYTKFSTYLEVTQVQIYSSVPGTAVVYSCSIDLGLPETFGRSCIHQHWSRVPDVVAPQCTHTAESLLV